MDTIGQEEMWAWTEKEIRKCDGFILMYSITSYQSFDEAQLLYEKISRIKEYEMAGFDLILVGNKIDLERKRQINPMEPQKLADEWDVPHFVQSAKNINEVRRTFQLIVDQMIKEEEEVKVETVNNNACGRCNIL